MIHLLLALKFGRTPAGFTVIMRILQHSIRGGWWRCSSRSDRGAGEADPLRRVYPRHRPLVASGVLTLLMAATALHSTSMTSGTGCTVTAGRAAPVSSDTGHCRRPRSSLLPCLRPASRRGQHLAEQPIAHAAPQPLHFRKPNSVARSWAFLIAAYILYIPANVLPIMETSSLFGSQDDTIMSGVIYLWHSGSWDLALVVFIASIMVPLLKLIAMTLLLVSVQRRSIWQPLQRTRLYRIVELVGRWSMLDIYVVTILAALVQIGSLATIKAGPAALAFGAVVVLTMFAAMQFDPRLIWDPLQKERPEHDVKIAMIRKYPTSPRRWPNRKRRIQSAAGLADPDRCRHRRRNPGGQDLPAEGADHHHHLQDRRRAGGRQDQDQVQGRRDRHGQGCQPLPRTSST